MNNLIKNLLRLEYLYSNTLLFSFYKVRTEHCSEVTALFRKNLSVTSNLPSIFSYECDIRVTSFRHSFLLGNLRFRKNWYEIMSSSALTWTHTKIKQNIKPYGEIERTVASSQNALFDYLMIVCFVWKKKFCALVVQFFSGRKHSYIKRNWVTEKW